MPFFGFKLPLEYYISLHFVICIYIYIYFTQHVLNRFLIFLLSSNKCLSSILDIVRSGPSKRFVIILIVLYHRTFALFHSFYVARNHFIMKPCNALFHRDQCLRTDGKRLCISNNASSISFHLNVIVRGSYY
jgi:hypothetical protein